MIPRGFFSFPLDGWTIFFLGVCDSVDLVCVCVSPIPSRFGSRVHLWTDANAPRLCVSFQRKPYVIIKERQMLSSPLDGTTGWRVASAAMTGSTKEECHRPARDTSFWSPLTQLRMLQYTYYVLSCRGLIKKTLVFGRSCGILLARSVR